MAHIPHVLVAGPWNAPRLALDSERRHHLDAVLRRADGDVVSYTDGAGREGTGSYVDGGILRGPERERPRTGGPVMAVAPPAAKDRQRFLVEKLAELGVPELRWIAARFGQGRAPSSDKVRAWSEAALEQSRRTWLMEVDGDATPVEELPAGTVFFDREGTPLETGDLHAPCLAVGPEGGWAPGEIPARAAVRSLGTGVLRVETAALAVAALACLALPPVGDHSAW